MNRYRVTAQQALAAVFAVLLGTLAPLAPATTRVASAATVGIPGSSWFGGHGVTAYNLDYNHDVCIRSSDIGTKNDVQVGLCGGAFNFHTEYGWGYQCVELALRMYAAQGWLVNPWSGLVGFAWQIYDNAGRLGFQAHRIGDGYSPVPGDLIIYSPWSATGPTEAGHVAVIDKVNGSSVRVVEENWSGGTGNARVERLSNPSIRGIVHSPKNTGVTPILNPVSGGVALRADGKSGYRVDGFGNITAFGGAPGVSSSSVWPNWNIVRGIALRPDGVSGYILDGYGGVHAFGGAPVILAKDYWAGWDIARGIVLDPDGNGGQVLDGYGGLHPFGNAPHLPISAYWSGWDTARGLALDADGLGGQVLDGWGGVHHFGNAPLILVSQNDYWKGWDIARGVALLSDNVSGYVLDGWGGVHPFGQAPRVTSTLNYHGGWDTARGIAAQSCAGGACGAISTFGDPATGTVGNVQVVS